MKLDHDKLARGLRSGRSGTQTRVPSSPSRPRSPGRCLRFPSAVRPPMRARESDAARYGRRFQCRPSARAFAVRPASSALAGRRLGRAACATRPRTIPCRIDASSPRRHRRRHVRRRGRTTAAAAFPSAMYTRTPQPAGRTPRVESGLAALIVAATSRMRKTPPNLLIQAVSPREFATHRSCRS